MKRVFIAINLPEIVKKDLAKIVTKIRPLFGSEVRFLSPANWHLTIEFLAYQDDHSISLICRAIEETAENFSSPLIQFQRIVYGPIGKTPRMIWLTGSQETSERLAKIKSFLEKKLFESGVRFRQEERVFNAHLTVARFETTGRANLPSLELDFQKQFEAQSLDLMESHLKKSGAEYESLGSFDFGSK